MPFGQRPRLAPYSEFSRPVWLDIMDRMRRPFPVRDTFGYADEAMPSIPTTVPTLASQTDANGTEFTVGTDQGAYFVAKQPVLVGDDASSWQLLVVQSVADDVVTCLPSARENWAAGSKFMPLWTNASHLTASGYKWLAALLATAKLDEFSFVGPNLLGDIGQMAAYTGQGEEAAPPDLPDGWAFVDAGEIGAGTVHSAWAETTDLPVSRIGGTSTAGYGIKLVTAATDTGDNGIELADAIPVRPGEEYVLSALCAGTGSGSWSLQAYDATNSAVIAEFDYPGDYSIGYVTESVYMRRFSLRFRIPAGTAAGAAPCASLQVRYVTAAHEAAARTGYLDDVILTPARCVRGGNVTAYPNTAEYVVPDVRPNPIMLFGDSWAEGSDTASGAALFISTLKARWPGLRIINQSHTGYKLYQLNAVFDAQVRPLYPAVVVHYSGMANDAIVSRTQTQLEGDVDTFIDNARSIGARPVFLGMAPATNSTGGDFAEAAARNRYMRERVAQHMR